MTVYKCDKCGKLEAEAKVTIDGECTYLDEEETGRTVRVTRRVKHKYDLCRECAQNLEEWITGHSSLYKEIL